VVPLPEDPRGGVRSPEVGGVGGWLSAGESNRDDDPDRVLAVGHRTPLVEASPLLWHFG